ncbi:MAG: hypothetical protein JSW27_12195 [Phycisphaerales bacterium]|nr:MAG: hypothetical protein JSW27_12195 [Phycisphaerales bacterium]
MSGRSRKILIGITVVVVVLGVLYGVSLARSKAKLRRAYADLEQDGRPMDAGAVLPPEVPDAQNAAVLYERAVTLMKAEFVDGKDLLAYLAKHAGSFLNDSLEPEERAEFERWVQHDAVREAMSLVTEGNERPGCRFQQPDQITLDENPPMAQDVRSLGIILGVRAYLAAEQGQPREAWKMVVVQLGFAKQLLNDPVMPGAMMELSLIGHACRVVKTLCETAPPDEAEYQRIAPLLRDLDVVEPFVRCVDARRLAVGERVFSLPQDELEEVWRRESWSGGESDPSIFHRLTFRYMMYRPNFIAGHADYLQLMRKTADLLEGPYEPGESAVYQEIRDLAFRYPLTYQLGILGASIKQWHCRMVADVRATRAGLALLRYQQAHGDFPSTLEALKLEGLVDPYDEEPLRYRAEGDGFLVYSVGGDLKDNDGLLERPRRSSDPRAKKKEPEYDRGWRFGQTQADAEDEE